MYYVKSLRLAYLVSQYPATNHTFILREIVALRERGFDLSVASIRPSDRPAAELTAQEREEAANTFYVKSSGMLAPQLWTSLRRPLRYAAGFAYALRLAGPNPQKLLHHAAYFLQAVVAGHWMTQNHIRHVHTHFSSTVALLIGRVFSYTWSVTFHGPDEFTDPMGFHLPEKCAQAAFVCAISSFAKSQLMRWTDPRDWPKYFVARLGVASHEFYPKPLNTQCLCVELLCVGRLAPVKAQHILIAVVEVLIRRGREVRLRIVGGGPSRTELEAEARRRGVAGHVLFEGPQNWDRVRELYAQADIFVLASFAEGVPVVLMEAMAMEIPCIATWVNGVPELIRDGIDGLLCPPGDVPAFAAAVERLMDDPELRRSLGTSARRRVQELHDLDKNAEILAGIFRSALG